MEYNNRQTHITGRCSTRAYYTSGKIIKLVYDEKFENCNARMYI